jgi:hypothetical protein
MTAIVLNNSKISVFMSTMLLARLLSDFLHVSAKFMVHLFWRIFNFPIHILSKARVGPNRFESNSSKIEPFSCSPYIIHELGNYSATCTNFIHLLRLLN